MPPTGRERCLDPFNLKRNTKSNMTKEERNTLQDLMNDYSIIFRPADKGTGIVMMNTEHYVNKAEDDLCTYDNTCPQICKDMNVCVKNRVKIEPRICIKKV